MKELYLSTAVGQCAVAESPDAERSAVLGALVRQALVAEAELTPKPGLVDRRGSGAHTDLSLDVMRRSALAIEPFIVRMALQSAHERPSARLRAKLAGIGRAAESAMLRVTKGSNTHKGAIWTLGLLAASAAAIHYNRDASDIARTAAVIASFDDAHTSTFVSHGQIVAEIFGVTGARGEAMQGFPHIVTVGLPTLRARRHDRVPEPIARLDALLCIMAELDDTCLLYRGGETALSETKNGAAAVIRAGGAGTACGRERLRALHRRLLELGVSPGGSADLFAGVLFLDAVDRNQPEIQPDESMMEKGEGSNRFMSMSQAPQLY
jgi:triphosphoribosyl-dephospho-CoA synthase